MGEGEHDVCLGFILLVPPSVLFRLQTWVVGEGGGRGNLARITFSKALRHLLRLTSKSSSCFFCKWNLKASICFSREVVSIHEVKPNCFFFTASRLHLHHQATNLSCNYQKKKRKEKKLLCTFLLLIHYSFYSSVPLFLPQNNTCSLHHSNCNEYWHSVFTPPSWNNFGASLCSLRIFEQKQHFDVLGWLRNHKPKKGELWIRSRSFVTFLWWILHEGFYANWANPAVSIIRVLLTHQKILTRLCFNSTDRWVADWKHDRQPSVTLCEI